MGKGMTKSALCLGVWASMLLSCQPDKPGDAPAHSCMFTLNDTSLHGQTLYFQEGSLEKAIGSLDRLDVLGVVDVQEDHSHFQLSVHNQGKRVKFIHQLSVELTGAYPMEEGRAARDFNPPLELVPLAESATTAYVLNLGRSSLVLLPGESLHFREVLMKEGGVHE